MDESTLIIEGANARRTPPPQPVGGELTRRRLDNAVLQLEQARTNFVTLAASIQADIPTRDALLAVLTVDERRGFQAIIQWAKREPVV